jgi:hypothetical protein
VPALWGGACARRQVFCHNNITGKMPANFHDFIVVLYPLLPSNMVKLWQKMPNKMNEIQKNIITLPG